MRANQLLSQLQGVRKQAKGWQARCPAHDDHKASLKVDDGEKGIVVTCFVGCSSKAICEALGIKERDLFYETTQTANGWERFPIKDVEGRLVAVRKRRGSGENKELLWELPNGKTGLGGLKTADLPLYGSEHLSKFDSSLWVELCEGEAKTYALQGLGAQALGTSTGASSAPSRQVLESLRGFKVRLWSDNDDAGRAHMKRIAQHLRELGIECVVLDTRSLPIKGDAVQWIEAQLQAGTTKAELRQVLQGDELPGLPIEGQAIETKTAPAYPAARTYRELLALKTAPRTEICGPWLKAGDLVFLHGWTGAGKSWFCLNLAMCVASGVNFMKWGVSASRKVLYIDGEMQSDDIQERLPLLENAESKRAGRPLDPNLVYLSDNDTERFPDGLPSLSTPEGKALVEANLEGVELVVIDNLSTLFNSSIENEAASWVEVQSWFLSMRRRGIAVLFVHHQGKDGNQRGTSKREDACNTVIALSKPQDWNASDGARFNLSFSKARGCRGELVAAFSAQLGTDEEGDLTWLLSTKAADQVAEWQAMHVEGMTTREIGKAFGVHHSTVARILAKTIPSQGGLSRVAPPRREGMRQSDRTGPQDATSHATSTRQEKQKPDSERIFSLTARDKVCDKPATSLSHPPSGLSQPMRQEMRQDQPPDQPTTQAGTYLRPEKAANGESSHLPLSYFNGVGTHLQRPLKE